MKKQEVITEQKDIENDIFKYYQQLFEEKSVKDIDVEEFLSPEIADLCPRICDEQKEKMEGALTTNELTKYLKKTKNKTAPGSSGFTSEFFKFFWIDLKIFVTNALNYGFTNGSLSITQRLGIITIIPKGDKDKSLLKNWRPLTLLNCLYKLVSGCVAERIKPQLDKIIHNDQKGFVSGRFIGEAIRSTYDIMNWANTKEKTGILLLIDFQKAYDSLSFSYIEKCLKFFNFGSSIIRWVKILLHNFHGVINHCGNISKKFAIGRGARQGDPIASYIFIICLEILAHKLRSDRKIKGFQLKNNMTKLLELYADDCTIFLEPSEENLKSVLRNS